jgi:hypothetical protein
MNWCEAKHHGLPSNQRSIKMFSIWRKRDRKGEVCICCLVLLFFIFLCMAIASSSKQNSKTDSTPVTKDAAAAFTPQPVVISITQTPSAENPRSEVNWGAVAAVAAVVGVAVNMINSVRKRQQITE